MRSIAPGLLCITSIAGCVLLAGCDFGPKEFPAESPGLSVNGLGGECPTVSDCLVWSADSKTLYVIASDGAPNTAKLMAVDPLSRSATRVGGLEPGARAPVLSPDGKFVYYAVPDSITGGEGLSQNPKTSYYTIRRIPLAGGSTSFVMHSGYISRFLISPDGSAIAFHASGSVFGADTIVLLDIASGLRRGKIVTPEAFIGAISPDGSRLMLMSTSLYVWNVASGARDTISVNQSTFVRGAEWVGANMHALLSRPSGYADTTMVAGGSAIAYPGTEQASVYAWLPARGTIFFAHTDGNCYDERCSLHHWEFTYVTATTSKTIGSMNEAVFIAHSASPDGRWLAYLPQLRGLYLLRSPAP